MNTWPTPTRIIYTGHALRQMFARRISADDVLTMLAAHEVVTDYPDDTPLPSRLLLGCASGRVLHLVMAYDAASGVGHVITIYEPDPAIWQSDWRTRRRP